MLKKPQKFLRLFVIIFLRGIYPFILFLKADGADLQSVLFKTPLI